MKFNTLMDLIFTDPGDQSLRQTLGGQKDQDGEARVWVTV